MAEQRIQFTIGSIFKGEGFKQAQAAVSNVNKAVKSSAAMIGNLASNIGILDAKYAKAASAVTGLTSALMSGSPAMAAFGVAMTGVSLIVSHFNEKLAEQKKQQDELTESLKRIHDQMVQVWSDQQAAQMEKFNANLKDIADSYDIITRQANELIAATNKLAATKSTGQDIQMQIDKLLNGRQYGGAQKQLEDAKMDLAVALKKSADAEERAQEKIDAASKARIDAQSKIDVINLQILEAEGKYQENLKELNRIGSIDTKIKQQLTADNEGLQKKISELNKQRTNAEDNVVKADRDLAQAIEEKKNVELQSKLSRLQAEDKVADANNAIAEELRKEKEAQAKKLADEDAAKQKHIDEINKLTQQREKERQQLKDKLQKELDTANNRLNDALDQLGTGRSGGGDGGGGNYWGGAVATQREQTTSNAWNNNPIARALIMGTTGNFFNNGGANQIGERLNLQGAENQQTAHQLAKMQALNQGASLNAAERAGRDAARAYRDAASSKEARQMAQDARRLAQLAEKEKSGQKLTQKEKQQKQDLERQQNAKNAEIDRAKQQAQNIKDLPNNIAKLQASVGNIEKKLEKLGLK